MDLISTPAMKSKILIVEDEKSLIKILKYNLEKEGYVVLCAYDGQAGFEALEKFHPHLIILDIMLPKMSGLDFLKALRVKTKTPVLVLTAKKDEVDRVLGLELGADDYVTKPFSVRELLARVKSILRRSSETAEASSVVKAGSLKFDFERYECQVSGESVLLGPKEWEFLRCLYGAQGKVLSRDEILKNVWGYERGLDLDTRTVDQHVARLREKLGAEASRIVTVKNVGYRLKLDS